MRNICLSFMIEALGGVGPCPTNANVKSSTYYQQGWAMPNNTIDLMAGVRAGLGSARDCEVKKVKNCLYQI
jgi:hypothetical protein